MFDFRNTKLVAKREYMRTVRRPSFWIATFLFPTLIGVVSFISGYSAEQAEERIKEEVANVDMVLVMDDSGLLDESLLTSPYVSVNDKAKSIDKVKNGDADAFFYYPDGLMESFEIEVYAPDTGLMSRTRFDSTARELVRSTILQEVGDPDKIQLYYAPLSVETVNYKDGEMVEFKLEELVVPTLMLIVYFLMTFLASNFLLMSVSEEKESRMIEIILSVVKPSELITGKLIGLIGVVLTQLFVLSSAGYLIIRNTLDQLPFGIDFASITVDPAQLGFSLFYVIAGFLFIATIMVGVGAAMPTYKDANSFSAIFIMLSIFPIYFSALIIQEPSGLIARVLSYFPFTAPLILLSRNILGALPMWEMILSSFLLLIYVAFGFWLSFKLFEIGSLEYNNKLSFKRLFGNK